MTGVKTQLEVGHPSHDHIGGGRRANFLGWMLAGFAICAIVVQLVDRTRDDDRMPDAGISRAAIERESSILTPWVTDSPAYVSYPLIEQASLRDISEGVFNGPEGFAYFATAPARKTGVLPTVLGGKSGWRTDVWASNFQGPVEVVGRSDRAQMEWTANGTVQDGGRRPYPFVFGVLTSATPSSLADRSYGVFEHDEDLWWNPWSQDDYLGSIVISHGQCRQEVFDRGLRHGWTELLTAKTSGSIEVVRYRLFCFQVEPATP